ncbi:MAG: hypothetical protein JNJ77_19955 [Planctomycetia bacterium]|nr:hypothetical protein [Planctomycetia bacterium]
MAKIGPNTWIQKEMQCTCGGYLKMIEQFKVVQHVEKSFWNYHSRKKCGVQRSVITYTRKGKKYASS